MTTTMQWVYQVLTLGTTFRAVKDDELEATLNLLGEDGWEIVNIYPVSGSNKMRVLTKKPLTDADRRRSSLPGY